MNRACPRGARTSWGAIESSTRSASAGWPPCTWPAAAPHGASEEDWEDLIPIFGKNQMIPCGDYGGYTDVRLAIVDDGDWIFCVDGD